MSRTNRAYQKQIDYLPYSEIINITSIDSDYQYEEFKTKVDNVVANFFTLKKYVEKHKNFFTQK